jgi:hypothetical protein
MSTVCSRGADRLSTSPATDTTTALGRGRLKRKRNAGLSGIAVLGWADRVVAAVEPLSDKDWMLVTVTFPFGEKEGDAIRRCGVSTQRRRFTTGRSRRGSSCIFNTLGTLIRRAAG